MLSLVLGWELIVATNNIRRYGLGVVFAVAALCCAQTASADTIEVTWGGWGGANFGSGGVGYGSGSIAPNPTHPGPFGTESPAASAVVGVGVGGDSFNTTQTSYTFSGAGSFNAWCVDITHWLNGGTTTYTIGGTAELASIFGNTRVADLQTLADERYLGLATQTDSGAFQLAVWSVMFGSKDSLGHYELQSNTFYATSGSTGYSEAQGWLNTLGTVADTGEFNITYLYRPVPGSQNLISLTPIPEPETYALMLAGLGFVATMVRRRQSKDGSLRFSASNQPA